MRKNELRELFLKLDKEDTIKVIGHSYLNIENELDVALLALDWIKENDQVKHFMSYVRLDLYKLTRLID